MRDAHDHSKLKWIRAELDALLSQSSRALEDFAEETAGPEAIESCIDHLHQVRGTLQLMQLYGAAMLAEEMELVAIAIRDGQTSQRDAAIETLMLGLVHLPSYLEKLERGSRDIPLLVLPMLNELRAARDSSLLSEVALFAPELEQILGSNQLSGTPNPELQQLAHRLRQQYHKGLIKWYRETDVDAGLQTIGTVLSELSQHAGTEKVQRMFKAGWAVTEGLREEGGNKPGFAFKEMFGKLDREIKRIIDVGEELASQAPTNELLKNFLYYVASSSSNNHLLEEVRDAFGLKQGLFSQQEIDQERQSLQAFDQDLLGSLRTAIGSDLTTIKDGLDLFIRSAESDQARLHELEAPMRKVADTLGMIGQGALRERLKRQAEKIDALKQAQEDIDEATLMAMAGDILFIETSLDNLGAARTNLGVGRSDPDGSGSMLPEGEFEKLADSVIREAEVDMARNREAILEFIANPQRPELLEAVPARFLSVAGAFKLMGLGEAAELLRGLASFSEQVARQGELPPQESLNRFADALTSVEYYMEGVTEGQGVQPEILRIAEQALASLGVMEPVTQIEAPLETEQQEAAGEEFVEHVDEIVVDEVAPLPHEMVDREQEVAEPVVAAVADALDPEIQEIFLEEAGEELRTIQEQLPRWCENIDDQEALKTTRRSFHTLKGSGRLVGATLIGDFAWSIENMLNRVIDGTADCSPALLAVMREALEVLPGLIDNQASGSALESDYDALMARAFALAEGKEAEHAEAAAEGDAASAPDEKFELEEQVESDHLVEPEAGLESNEEPGQSVGEPASEGESELPPAAIEMDPDLAAIFVPETLGHIQEVQAFIRDCRADPAACELSGAGITRALHTLHGSAEMTDIESIATLSSELESMIGQRLQAGHALADEGLLGLLEVCTDCMSAILDVINVPDSRMPEWEPLLDRIDAQAETAAALGQEPESAESAAPVMADAGIEELQRPESELPAEGAGESVAPVEPARSAIATAAEPVFDEIEGESDLIEIFVEEARELLDSIESGLQAWREAPESDAPVSDLQRTLHTLKGGARLSGIMTMGDLSHAFETLLVAETERGAGNRADLIELAQAVSDRLAEQIDDLSLAPRVRRGNDLIARIERFSAGSAEPAEPMAAPAVAPVAAEPAAVTPAAASQPAAEASPVAAGQQRAPTGRREQIRVPADLLDKLVNNAGEVSIYRSRIEQQNTTLGFNLNELEQTVERLRAQLRSLDIETEAQILFRFEREKEERDTPERTFDPLEMDRFSNIQQLSRSLLETVNDLTNINGFLEDLHKEAETLLLQQARVANDLQDGLLRTRMVPFSQLVPRLQRLVRQTAATLGKQAELRIRGAEGELDRSILDRMIGPVEHILRNAVSHGIETVAQREAADKPHTGRIDLNLIREGNDVVLSIADDGAGLDTDAIRRQAIENGLLAAEAELPESDIIQFVLEHGFSTQSEVTQISGRGVGLDVVIKEVKNLGGSLDIDSQRGKGTTFVIRLPLTLAISDALLVELGDEIYAVPHVSIEGVVRLGKTELLNYYDGRSGAFSYADHEYRVQYLGSLLNVGQFNPTEQRKWYPLLLVRAGDHRVALQVDGLIGNRQIVVKSVGPQISTVRWISGGTILGDGRVALILDVTALVRMDVAQALPSQVSLPPAIRESRQRTVMVVDDSITVRKVTGRVLERNGMKVITAKDGVDAVALLQEQLPDIMLLDIEMPRMDGYELARHMRNTDELKSIPIIMITSRTGDKHRKLALDLGVKRYLGKPYQESELLDNIYSLLAEEGP